MSTKYFKLWRPRIKHLLTAAAVVFAGISLHAGTTATTIAGGKPSKYYGYSDTTILQSLFHTPSGLAMDSAGHYLFVADRDNNAVRYLDFSGGLTWTFTTNYLSKPIAVQIDNSFGDIYVLNKANGTNGYIVSFDNFGNLIATNASGLKNPGSMVRDLDGNLYVTVNSNKIVKINPSNVVVTNIPVPYLGANLSGMALRADNHLAVCDAGLDGVYDIDLNTTNYTITLIAGFNGPGDFTTNGNNVASATQAKFRQPMSIAEAGDGSLIVADYGNNRLKVISGNVVTNLEGITQKYWHGSFPGWQDGPVIPPDSNTTNAESREPFGVAFGPDGTVYMSEDYYHTIRKVTGASFGLPPPPPAQLPAPEIGYVTWVLNASDIAVSQFNQVTNVALFNNTVPIVIVGQAGSETFYNYSNTPTVGLVPDPTSSSAEVGSGYQDGLTSIAPYVVAGVAPNVSIKAISESNDGAPNSPVASARFEFVTANPQVSSQNAASFQVNEITANSQLIYTTDGSNPLTSTNTYTVSFGFDTNGDTYDVTLHFPTNNFWFEAYAASPNFQNSQVISNYFSAANFKPNIITFGVTNAPNGELSSSFIARPGQFYYAPVTFSVQPGGESLYSLQFNLTVTNGPTTTAQIANDSGFNFFTMLMSSVPPAEGDHFPPNNGTWYLEIPTVFGSSLDSTLFTNSSENLLGVDWSYRTGFHYLNFNNPPFPNVDFNTSSQDLLTYSIAHDNLFQKSGGVVILGAYSFNIPTNANIGDTYSIQIGSPSGTRDGAGASGNDVFIQAPATPQLITVGTPSYLVGDAAPFRWLNAGDFGDNTLDSADVSQIYQAAIEGVDVPPVNSDLFAAMDSSGYLGIYDTADGYYTNSGNFANFAAMFNGDDTSINTNCFGDGLLDASDVFVTYRRSLDPSLTWFRRFWTNGQFVAVSTPNLAFNSNNPAVLSHALTQPHSRSVTLPDPSKASVLFIAGDAMATAGQTTPVHIPITANILGGYPMTVVGLNVTVEALDGSPAITNPAVVFTPGAGLGVPTMYAQMYPANYTAAWLTNSIAGLTGTNALIGTLTVTIPTNATSSSAYAIHFNHASGSPNGLASFPNSKYAGLITLSSRTNSSYNDGIPDSWRLRWFGTVNNALSQSNAIPAGDGITTWQKYVAGVDPTIPNDFPALQNVSPVPTGYKAIHWPSVYGKQYVILGSPNLFAPSWSILSTNTGTGGDMEYDDSSASTVKFYRVLIQQ